MQTRHRRSGHGSVWPGALQGMVMSESFTCACVCYGCSVVRTAATLYSISLDTLAQ